MMKSEAVTAHQGLGVGLQHESLGRRYQLLFLLLVGLAFLSQGALQQTRFLQAIVVLQTVVIRVFQTAQWMCSMR